MEISFFIIKSAEKKYCTYFDKFFFFKITLL